MTVPLILAAVGLLAVLVALARDADDAPIDRDPDPGWAPLPHPADVVATRFGMAWPGYDPAEVEVAFERLRAAYTDLYESVSVSERERASARVATRLDLGAGEPRRQQDTTAEADDPPEPLPRRPSGVRGRRGRKGRPRGGQDTEDDGRDLSTTGELEVIAVLGAIEGAERDGDAGMLGRSRGESM